MEHFICGSNKVMASRTMPAITAAKSAYSLNCIISDTKAALREAYAILEKDVLL